MNYRQIYARKAECENRIKEVCDDLSNRSGIYVFFRIDESGLKFCYVGQAKNLLQRCAQHLQEYDHLASSIKKRGFYNPRENKYGWRICFKEYPETQLDKMEQEYIIEYANSGYQLFNRTAGGQGDGKVVFDTKKQSKTYREGLAQGYLNARREVAHWFSLHLAVSMKKPTKNAEKALTKFMEFIDLEAEENV
jgi:hypothetical protein